MSCDLPCFYVALPHKCSTQNLVQRWNISRQNKVCSVKQEPSQEAGLSQLCSRLSLWFIIVPGWLFPSGFQALSVRRPSYVTWAQPVICVMCLLYMLGSLLFKMIQIKRNLMSALSYANEPEQAKLYYVVIVLCSVRLSHGPRGKLMNFSLDYTEVSQF